LQKITFKSKFEEYIYAQLVRRYGKSNVEYEPDKFNYVIPYSYTPDFRVATDGSEDGPSRFYVETKGYFRPQDRRLVKAVREQNPTLDLRLLFQRDQKLNKRGKEKYSDWAHKEQFEYAIGRVPNYW